MLFRFIADSVQLTISGSVVLRVLPNHPLVLLCPRVIGTELPKIGGADFFVTLVLVPMI